MRQTIFTITNPGGMFFGDTLREAVSHTKLCPPEVFNHAHDGSTLNTSPSLRFLATKSWVGVLCAADRPDLLNPAALAITQVVSNFLQEQTLRCRTLDSELSGTLSSTPITYVAKNIAIKRYFGHYKDEPGRATRKCRTGLNEQELLKYAINRCLLRAYQGGTILDLPPDDELDLRIIDAKRSGVGNHYLVSGKFQMHLKLSGCWQAGTMQSKGYGLIGRVNRGGFTQWIS